MAKQTSSDLHIARPVYQIEDLHKDTLYEKPYSTVKSKAARYCKPIRPKECLLDTIPLLRWLPEYSWQRNLVSDIISGLTIATMHIPQGMAYGLLGRIPPINGIYMAFYPVLVYVFFGTSKHVSLGTGAIISLLAGRVVNEYANIEIMENGTAKALDLGFVGGNAVKLTNVQVTVTITFGVAVLQLVMFVLRLGAVTSLLSDTLVSGFTCAAVFHVASSQLKNFFGLKTHRRNGKFSFVFTLYDTVRGIPNANSTAITVSLLTVCILVFNNEFFKPWLSKKCQIPLPIELIAVSVGTAVTYFTGIHETHNVTTVGFIPTGLPELSIPVFSLIPHIWMDILIITMVSYTITISMALLLARKVMYEIDCNQELLALGLSNSIGSFFSCIPIVASFSRSVIQEKVGGVTQIASVVSCALLLNVLLWAGPVFQTLPLCVLASIILVALKSLLIQIRDLPRYWRLSRWDGFVWAITFFTTLLVEVSVGVVVGIVASILSVAVQGLKPHASILGRLAGTDLYLDMERHKATVDVPGLKIIRFVGGLSFASTSAFKKLFNQKVGLDAAAILRKRAKLRRKSIYVDEEEDLLVRGIIIDFSSLTFLDPSGVAFLRQLQTDLENLDISLYIAGCSGKAYEVITNCDMWEKKDTKFTIFATVHDAVLYAQSNILAPRSIKNN